MFWSASQGHEVIITTTTFSTEGWLDILAASSFQQAEQELVHVCPIAISMKPAEDKKARATGYPFIAMLQNF